MSTALKTAAVVKKVTEEAPALRDVRVIPNGTMKAGQGIRQGDIYLVLLDKNGKGKVKLGLNKQEVEIDASTYIADGKDQLVPGFTQGSRHSVRQTDKVRVKLNPTPGNPLLGPVIVAKERFTLEHPSHAHFELPAGIYGVCYQLNPQTNSRVRD